MKQFILLLLFTLSTAIQPAHGDWINLSGAENSRNISEIYVEGDHVKVKLEIFVQDLKLFAELIPDRLFKESKAKRPSAAERIRQFSEQKFTITTDQGEKLKAEQILAEPRMRIKRPSPLAGKMNPLTRQPIPGPPDDKRVLYVELVYPFTGKPKSLTFNPPVGERGMPTAAIGFVCYHEGVMVVDFRQLTPDTVLNLDWDDPWYSSFSKRQYQRRLLSGVRTYLYIEPYEVRHEILVRVRDMMNWMSFDLRGKEFIEEDEFDPVRHRIAQFFMDRENVLIDGEKYKPILDKTAYVESSMTRSRFIEIPERVPLNTAMIGVVITYLTDGVPGQVETRWNLFSEKVQKVTGSMIDPAGPFPYDLEPGDEVLKWTNYLNNYQIPTVDVVRVEENHIGMQIPILSIVSLLLIVPFGYAGVRSTASTKRRVLLLVSAFIFLCGSVFSYPMLNISVGGSARASQISDEDMSEIVLSLLKNVYRAFDFREEKDVYDKLAISVSGDLLTNIYLQSRKSLIVEQAGGAQAKVEDIEILGSEVQGSAKGPGAVDVRTQWTATGTVGHWGHIHTRRNVYDAILTLKVVDNHWKISELEVLEEKRVDPYANQQKQAAL